MSLYLCSCHGCSVVKKTARECSPFGEQVIPARRGFSPRAEQHLRRAGLLHDTVKPHLNAEQKGVYR